MNLKQVGVRILLELIVFGGTLINIYTEVQPSPTHTVEYDPFSKSQVAFRNVYTEVQPLPASQKPESTSQKPE